MVPLEKTVSLTQRISISKLDCHKEKAIDGISFRTYHSDHVLGVLTFMIELASVEFL